uniref:Transient receptor potential cation channel subfamily A member 1 homolog n=1 Tax=Phallusia mammillata TaxID=59560 RepID=A0A6F9DV17_9ASCI|nr:transient receptor potential cation channel subfamily A member 1 homolog [Phallusia mammillata]
MPPPFSIDSGNVTSSCVAISPEAQPNFGPCYDYNSFGIIVKYFIIVLSTLSILKELYLVYLQRIAYLLSFRNVFDISLHVLAILTVYSDTSSEGPNYVGVREAWQWQTGAISIFLSWMVILAYYQSVPTLGLYVLMFTHVLRTFLKFMVVFSLFTFSFACSFHCLLQNQYAFRDLNHAVMKTTLMMIGEFQFEDIFVAEFMAIETGADNHTIATSTVNYRVVSYSLFAIFIIFMSIILMNLQVGLAVDDIKSVRNNAYLESLAMQVKVTLDIHYTLPKFIRRRFMMKVQNFFPNKYRRTSRFIQWLWNLSSSVINEAINYEKNDPNKLEKQIESLDQKVKGLDRKFESLEDKIAILDNRSSSMESMMSAMMSHFKINGKKDDVNGNDMNV